VTPHRNAPCECGSGKKRRLCHGMSVFVPGTDAGPGGNRYVAGGVTPHQETSAYLHVLVPSRGTVCVETMNFIASLGWLAEDAARLGVARATFLCIPRLGVADARERLAEAVLRGMEAQPKAQHFVLWLDDDAAPTLNDIIALLAELRRSKDLGLLSCYYSPKVRGHPGFVPRWPRAENGHESALRVPGVDFQAENVVEVPWVGLHCALMRGEVLRGLRTPRFPCDPATGCGEDVGFSHRIRDAGWKLAVHAGIIVPHVDAETGEQFIPDIGATRIAQEDACQK
jgi:hypothetical protein